MTYRITQQSIAANTQANLQASINRSQTLQNKLSSGREITRPSDAPAGTVSALQLRSTIRRSDQLLRNADDAVAFLNESDSALNDSLSLIRRARELALRGVNDTMNPQDRLALAVEVDTLREHALALANTTYLGQPLFAGTKSPAPAGTPDLAYDGTATYIGDAGALKRNISPNVSVQINLNGPDVFGAAGADRFTVLANIADDLRNNPADLAPTDVAALDDVFARVNRSLATVGARMNQVETIRAQVDASRVQQLDSLSTIENVDLPKTIADLQMQEVAYQAALAATSRVIQPSLIDFLR